MASQVEDIDIGSVIQAAVDAANAMCNPDKWQFEWDWLGEDCIVNCRCKQGYTRDNLEDAYGYCNDLSQVVERLLQKHDDESWHMHSEPWVWAKNGDEIEGGVEDDELSEVDCVQHQFYKVEE